MVTKTVMMTQQNVEHPHLPAAGGAASSSITQTLLSNSPPNSPVIVSASKLREEEKRLQMVICDINVQIATFRDLLIHVGTAKDAPELREKIRRVRRQCVEACKQTNNQLMPQIKTALAEGNILDNQQLICLYMLSQLLERELVKCLRLVVAIPMDMSSFYEPKQNPNGLGNLLSQIVIGTTGTRPDFNVEEKASIEKDTRELRQIIREMGDYLPREDPEKDDEALTIQEPLTLSQKGALRVYRLASAPLLRHASSRTLMLKDSAKSSKWPDKLRRRPREMDDENDKSQTTSSISKKKPIQ